jgi:hypothetical protein
MSSEEHRQQPRVWRDTSVAFRRRLEAVWFAYFEHLGLTPDYLLDALDVNGREFQPCMWIREWSMFVYLLPSAPSMDRNQREVSAEAEELSRQVKEFDVIVACGNPDESETYVELHSSELSKFLHSWTCDKTVPTNMWVIAGTIDKQKDIAYYWTLISPDNFGYIPGTRQWYSVCFCAGNHCNICERFESFLPVDAYGTAFGIDINRHLPCESRRKARRSRGGHLCRR